MSAAWAHRPNPGATPKHGWLVRASLCAALVLLSACASGPHANPNDPLEPLNRSVYQFNDAVDQAVLRPVAQTYQKVTPAPLRQGVSNFFSNLDDLWSLVNNALQLKPQAATESLLRVGFNTTFGIAGIFDIASAFNIEKHSTGFGDTLGHWGVGAGPYVVLPLLGPSTLRDTAGSMVDRQADQVRQLPHVPTRNTLLALRLTDTRAAFLGASRMLDQVALDKYSFTRDAYLQRRQRAIGVEDDAPTEEFTPAAPPPEPTPNPSSAANPIHINANNAEGGQP